MVGEVLESWFVCGLFFFLFLISCFLPALLSAWCVWLKRRTGMGGWRDVTVWYTFIHTYIHGNGMGIIGIIGIMIIQALPSTITRATALYTTICNSIA